MSGEEGLACSGTWEAVTGSVDAVEAVPSAPRVP